MGVIFLKPMRFVGDIPHPKFKISIFNWNGKYLLKIEAGMYEQTYKVNEMDMLGGGEEEIKGMVSEAFLSNVMDIFTQMHSNLLSVTE